MTTKNNPLGLMGIEFTEYASPDSDYMDKIFTHIIINNTNIIKTWHIMINPQ